MARTMASQSLLALTLPLILMALLPGTSRAARVSEHSFLNEEGDRAPAHMRLLAARGGDLQAFQAAVSANKERASVLLDTSGLEQPVKWPAAWKGKLGEGEEVGQGAFGKVFVAPLTCNGDKVAVKQMTAEDSDKDVVAEVEKEVNAMKEALGCANVIQYFADDKISAKSSKGEDTYYIMMEAASGGTLEDNLGSEDKLALFLGMLRGMQELHSRGLVHRDLKPANVMVSSKCGGKTPCYAKIGDLGLACRVSEVPDSKQVGVPKCAADDIAGTPLYMAPETFSQTVADQANDVWAMGVMLYQMHTGSLPSKIASSDSVMALMNNLQSFDIADDEGYKGLPESAWKELIADMLDPSETSRMSMAEALRRAEGGGAGGFADRASGPVPKLPDCFSKKAAQEAKDEEQHAPAEGDIASFVIKRPQRDSASMIFGRDTRGLDLVDGTGKVTQEIAKIKPDYLGAAKVLRQGDKILQVNAVPWVTFKNPVLRKRMLSGVDGPLVVKYQKA